MLRIISLEFLASRVLKIVGATIAVKKRRLPSKNGIMNFAIKVKYSILKKLNIKNHIIKRLITNKYKHLQ
tara:strand:- start:596 stop:805 length:210 start_codon:yes stop_codon:yes gene_type:complete